jgi:ABC-type lipoprotein export system ATPase subunit
VDTPQAVVGTSFGLSIARIDGTKLELKLTTGEILYVLGPNGSGKSSLILLFSRLHNLKALRISAHRRTWLDASTHNLSPSLRNAHVQNIQHEGAQDMSRWRDIYGDAKVNLSIYNLIEAENARARKITGVLEEGKSTEAERLLKEEQSPIQSINKILRLSNLPLTISISKESDESIVASKSGGPKYGIAQLSDGERNAVLIAAEVLTTKPSTLILIDEPERHLHRSIISPLLTYLFAERPDCAFIVSTHEVMLPIDNPAARTLLARECQFNNTASPVAWDIDLVPAEGEIEEDIRRTILGERRNMLFIEGTAQSLDKALYSLVFPTVSVVAKESCRDVIHAVESIRDVKNLHWIKAVGIIDNDGRAPEEIGKLRTKGVFALPVFSVESIYYHPGIQKKIAERQCAVNGQNPTECLAKAKASALAAILRQVDHLSSRMAEKTARLRLLAHMPRRQDILRGAAINVSIDTQSIVTEERSKLQQAVENGQIEIVIARYPVRETGALGKIAAELGFTTRELYEGAVQKLFVDDEEALQMVRSFLGELSF